MEKVRPWCGQPSDRGRLRNRTVVFYLHCGQLIDHCHLLYASLASFLALPVLQGSKVILVFPSTPRLAVPTVNDSLD